MKNIFEGAKFGDKFLLKNKRIGVLVHLTTYAIICIKNNEIEGFSYNEEEYYLNGKPMNNLPDHWEIISKYQEPIDKGILEELAYNECNKILINNHSELRELMETCFMNGYFKANGE